MEFDKLVESILGEMSNKKKKDVPMKVSYGGEEFNKFNKRKAGPMGPGKKEQHKKDRKAAKQELKDYER